MRSDGRFACRKSVSDPDFSTSNQIEDIGGKGFREDLARGVATAVAGGVGSVIAGGKFANGAETAAYGYLFNQLWSTYMNAFKRAHMVREGVSNDQFASELQVAGVKYAGEVGQDVLKFATSDVVDYAAIGLGASHAGKAVMVLSLTADAIDYKVNGKTAGLWGAGTATVLQKVSPAFKALPNSASSRLGAATSFGIEKGVENKYEKNK